MSVPSHVDVLIVGGGPVGGALALGLAEQGLSVLVAESRPQPGNDARALAVSHASVQTLAKLGLALPDDATAIRSIHVSQAQAFGRVRLTAADLALDALGYVLPYGSLAHATHQGMLASRVTYCTSTRVSAVQTLAAFAVATLQQGDATHTVTARLVVLAEGGSLLGDVGIAQASKDYRQHAIVAEINTSQPHQHVAFERFAHDGPIALLPRGAGDASNGRYAMVWTRPQHDPLAAIQLDDTALLAALQTRLGDRAGRLLQIGPRASFPLTLKWAKSPYAQRVAVVGNAAQTLHPVAGQGFNLGLRDAQTLIRLVQHTAKAELGTLAMLQRYARLRQQDSRLTIRFTDGLIGLFGLESPPLRQARALGIIALDNIPPLRQGFAHRMVFGSA